MPEEPHADFSGCVDPLDQCRARVVQARHFDLYALRPEVLTDFVERRHCGDVPEMSLRWRTRMSLASRTANASMRYPPKRRTPAP